MIKQQRRCGKPRRRFSFCARARQHEPGAGRSSGHLGSALVKCRSAKAGAALSQREHAMTLSRRTLLATAAWAPFASPRFAAMAQEAYPAHEIHVICGYAPGTGADLVVRFFAEKLRKITGKPMIVENKPGAGTSIAAEFVARAKPDGYTLFLNPGNGMASNPYLYKNLSHDVIRDFSPITTLIKLPFVLAVPPSSPATTAQELIAMVKAKGDKSSYGAPTNLARAAGELLNDRAGLKSVAVPYKSTLEAINDLNSGFIDFLWADATLALGLAQQGKLRILAMTTAKRSTLDPSIPTLLELGLRDFQLEAWWGAWYPANAPQPIVAQMATWLNQILADADTKQYFSGAAPAELFPGSPDSLAEYLKQDIPRWAEAYRLAKIEPQ
jgi:tripartite-type tricarboxylate transporter receptor subunit TctC